VVGWFFWGMGGFCLSGWVCWGFLGFCGVGVFFFFLFSGFVLWVGRVGFLWFWGLFCLFAFYTHRVENAILEF